MYAIVGANRRSLSDRFGTDSSLGAGSVAALGTGAGGSALVAAAEAEGGANGAVGAWGAAVGDATVVASFGGLPPPQPTDEKQTRTETSVSQNDSNERLRFIRLF